MNRIPSNPLDSSDGGLVQTLDTESRNFIKGATPVLKSMIGCSGCRAERLPTILATVSTSFPPSSRVEAMANDGSGDAFSRWWTVPVWTAETLHVSWTLSTPELMAWN
jgi:hypothetical protein